MAAPRRLPCNVYCINMLRSTARRQHMQRQFERLGWPAEFVDTVDGRDLDMTQQANGALVHPDNEGLNGHMTPGEIGCALSHAEAWRAFSHTGARYGLVCEDDIVLPEALDLWALLRWMPGDVDLVYLHFINDQHQGQMDPAFDTARDAPVGRAGGYAIYDAWSCGGTACYMVSQRAARTLLAHTRPLRYPSDGLLARLTARGVLQAYALWPKPAAIYPFGSTIR